MNEHLLKRNEEIYRKLNIPAWHAAGITGAGVNVAVLGYGGCLAAKKPYLTNVNEAGTGSYHDGDEIIHAVAPGAKIFGINIFRDGWGFAEALQWCLEHNIHVICTSIRLSSWDSEREELSRQLYEKGCIMIDSADNEGEEDSIGYPAVSKYWFAVGAYSELNKGKAGYSSWGKELDCLMYTDLAVEAREGYYVGISHTSGATQCVAGMAALLKEYLQITPDQFREFIRQNSIDIGDKGWDPKTGFGLFCLPAEIPARKEEDTEEMKPQDFINLVKPGAIESYKQYKILPSITIAQAALESAWGQSHIQYNLFGIKWTEGCGYDKVPRETTEYVNGVAKKVVAYFRGYKNFAESILDHAKLLAGARYAKVRQATDYKGAAHALQECGYATDPKYAEKLISIIEQYKLYEIDKEVISMSDYEKHWAKTAIEKVKAAGLMSGYPDGSFKPDQPVTRAELASVLARLLDMQK